LTGTKKIETVAGAKTYNNQ